MERRSGRCLALDDELGLCGIVAESVDDVCLPILRPVRQIGRIERGLAIREPRNVRLDLGEVLLRRIGGHGRWDEFSVTLRGEERHEFLHRVGTDRVRRRHHDARVLQDALARIVEVYTVQHDDGDEISGRKRSQYRQIELQSQSHFRRLPEASALAGGAPSVLSP